MSRRTSFVSLRRLKIARKQWVRYGHVSRGAEVSPWRIIWIRPSDILHESLQRGIIYPKSERVLSHVLDGDWDLDVKDFWDHEISEAIRQRIVESRPWGETRLVKRLHAELSRPGARPRWHKSRTPEDVDQRCRKLDELVSDIRANGFRPPPGIHQGQSGYTPEHPPDAISVAVTRDGAFQHLNGRHRLAIAKSLNLDHVPVRIGVRHTRWQEKRASFLQSDGGQPSEISRHPDVSFLTNTKGRR